MFSICPHLEGGYPSQVQPGGGIPKPGPAGGGGTPTRGVTPMGEGYPNSVNRWST